MNLLNLLNISNFQIPNKMDFFEINRSFLDINWKFFKIQLAIQVLLLVQENFFKGIDRKYF